MDQFLELIFFSCMKGFLFIYEISMKISQPGCLTSWQDEFSKFSWEKTEIN